MHEAREAAAQAAWNYCLEHAVLDLETIRELVRVIEPILAAGWRAAESAPIVHPDLWPSPVDESLPELPSIRHVELPDG